MAYLDLTSMNAALKELYDGQVVENLVYKDNPFLAMVKKMTDFGGKYKPVPIIIGVSQGRSSTFASALANQSAMVIDSFLLTRASDYSIATIDNQTMLASQTDKMAFLEGSKILIDGAIRSLSLSLSSALFRSGTGTIGRISSISTGVITLASIGDVVQFEINQTLQANSTDGGGTTRAGTGYVIAVNRVSGTVTVASSGMGGAAGTPSGWAANDYLSVVGDLNLKIKGLDAWLPQTDPSSGESFFGVDRSADRVRLAGYYYDGSGQSIEEALIDSSSVLAREGGTPNVCVTNYQSYSALEKALGAKVQYIDAKAGDIAFRGIMVNGANSQIKVFPDRNCQPQRGYLLQMDTWALNSLGDAPQILRYGDGLEMLRVYNSDAGELRCGYYAQLSTNAPGWNSNVKFSA